MIMLDITLIREKPDWVKEQLRHLNDEDAIARVDAILDLDQRRRALLTEVEAIKAGRNKLNKQMGQFRGNKKLTPGQVIGGARAAVAAIQAGDMEGALDALSNPTGDQADAPKETVDDALTQLTTALKNLGERTTEIDAEVAQIEADLQEHMYWIPNMPHESVRIGKTEVENLIGAVQGEMPAFDFEPLAHWDIGPALDIIDFERGVKMAGTRFYILKGMGARLYRAMIYWLLDVHTTQHGFTEIYPPFMLREEMAYGSAHLPKFRDMMYHDAEEDFYFLPTAEAAITNMHRDEILDEAQLPLYYVAHTPCFRREKMSAGRDVRGLKRVHQFEKVELYKFTTPETSYDELETLTQAAEHVCRMLNIPYRRIEMVTGDLGFAASKKYDVEMWAPGCGEWLEVSSCSNTEAFQARRANVRYRPEDGGRTRFVHTLNGSGLGMVRALIAVIENYQQKDGSIVVPDVLRPYMGGLETIEPGA
jgi:seryl-tRNA synthetase